MSALTPEESILRELLWIRHGCPMSALYGDDGEMQCAKCLLDFKRDSAQEIADRWRANGLAALQSPTEAPFSEEDERRAKEETDQDPSDEAAYDRWKMIRDSRRAAPTPSDGAAKCAVDGCDSPSMGRSSALCGDHWSGRATPTESTGAAKVSCACNACCGCLGCDRNDVLGHVSGCLYRATPASEEER